MRKGEKVTLWVMGVLVIGVMLKNAFSPYSAEKDRTIPYYNIASKEDQQVGIDIIRNESCRSCHSLMTVKNIMNSVPAPILDGMGSLHTEQWFYEYFSAKNPQAILPSRLKPEYRMPSYAYLPELQRHQLAHYLASLKVQDWYLDETKKAEQLKLTGEEPRHNESPTE